MSDLHPERARARWILPVIVLSQFAGTSLWFAGNAVLPELQREWNLPPDAIGYITSAVQFGFILGTLVFAFFAVSDRYSPRIVFFVCSLLGGVSGLGIFNASDFFKLLLSRFLTGFFLAGIYPVGMKIAAGWYRSGLGSAIGFLVGALVLGTAFPHLLKGLGQAIAWETVTVAVSATAVIGGLAMLRFVPDGPHLTQGARFDPAALAVIFRSRDFRASALGYFGHMWELYAFWAFMPFAITAHAAQTPGADLNVAFWSFLVIAAGAVGCAVGGVLSLTVGSARVAFVQLFASGVCCLASPLLYYAPTPAFLAFLVFWGVVVVGDSPQFSALNAQNAPRALVGSALTIANCIGFAITIFSIQLLNALAGVIPAAYLFLPLTLGPVLGLMAMSPLLRSRHAIDTGRR
ncbi:MAG: MFS transporter [Betaproteobacteria bacterium]